MEPAEQLQAMRDQILQGMLEHGIVVQALRAQSLVSLAFVLVLSLLSFWMWRRSVYCAEALIEQEKRHSIELRAKDEQRANEVITLQRQHSLELDSITRTSWREFAEAVLKRPGT